MGKQAANWLGRTMEDKNVEFVGNFITEDPDIFCETGGGGLGGSIGQAGSGPKPPTPGSPGTENVVSTDKPLTGTEIEQQADKEAGSEDASRQVADKLKMQQEMEKQAEMQRQKVIQPQIQQLHQAMDKLNTGVAQGQQAATTGGQSFGALEKEMTNVNSLLGNLEKQI